MRKSLLLLIAFYFISSISSTVFAQQFMTKSDTVTVAKEEVPSTTPPIMASKWNQISTKYFNLNIGFAFILDHNIANQNNDNIAQVGKVEDATEVRGDRLLISGNLLFFKRPWKYLLAVNYNGLDAPPDKKFDFVDWNLEIPLGEHSGWLTVGKLREGVGLEYISPGTQLMFTERGSGAPMFIRQRNIGFRYSNSVLNQRLTYTFGFFNNFIETGKSFNDNGSQLTGRISVLPKYESDRNLLHIAAGFRYTESSEGKLNYKAKPEVNSAPSYVNTGSFDAGSAGTVLGEIMKVNGAFSFIGEFMSTVVSSETKGNPQFYYLQAGASYFLTGENRRYNRMTGNQGKLIPKKNFGFKKDSGPGAIELGARFTQSNANDAQINGGKFSRFTGAISWYPDAHFRIEFNYGHTILEKQSLKGNADFLQFRLQYEL